ncbi:ABC transporter permease [Jiangella rhizosphaerae]|uniref:ABC transporter permease n=1 Tax=Jiangella rhizosphaerae TaxID=2293569 RepID=A0A418KS35_9ACTN|nr:ABC transporter permease subunit [Jiangella rhizosphaerae]RIQ25076.1 ABC transporter permease [Jiangella rhizosphaerae]
MTSTSPDLSRGPTLRERAGVPVRRVGGRLRRELIRLSDRAARARTAGRRPAGWRTVAAKEFGDHLTSIRFVVLLVIIGLAGVAAVVAAAGFLRDAASQATDLPSPFLLLFTQSPERIPSFVALVGFLGPLLGIAFGFDAINQERSDQTLPRLVAQPIHRDDVVNGKFAAGLAVIGLTLVALVAVTAGIGIVRMGITPSAADALRLLLYLVVALVYIGVWLAFALLCSVLLRRPATAALVAIAAWLVFTLFATLLAGLLADGLGPSDEAGRARFEHTVSQVSPTTLYEDATAALLNPQVRSVGLLLPEQLDRAVPGTLPVGQSLLVVWPQVTALVAGCTLTFAAAYVAFLRQEVRA